MSHTDEDVAFFAAHGWTYEYPGFLAYRITPDTMLTCAHDWSGTGLWEGQWQYDDGRGIVDVEGEPADFATREEMVMYAQFLRARYEGCATLI